MPRSGKGKHNVESWTTFRPGALHDQGTAAQADMFVDVSPYLSLAGANHERMTSRRASTHIDEHAIARTRGKHLREPMHHRRRQHVVTKGHHKEGY